jgi:PHD/YefM family antitoxin component YafN of YafNO toxin-antitoxin module
MPEEMKSISDARQNLPSLSRAAQRKMDRYIITHQGQPQSVLLGYDEYRGLKTAAELLKRPELVEDIRTGLKQLESGKRLSPSEARMRLRDLARSSQTSRLASELAARSGVDAKTIGVVVAKLINKILADFSATGKADIPGVGTVLTVRAPRRRSERDLKSKNRGQYLVLEPAPAVETLMAGKTER